MFERKSFWLRALYHKLRLKKIDAFIRKIVKEDLICYDEVLDIIKAPLIDKRFTNKYGDCIFVHYGKTKLGNTLEVCIVGSSLKNQTEQEGQIYTCLCVYVGQFDFRTCPRVLKAKKEAE